MNSFNLDKAKQRFPARSDRRFTEDPAFNLAKQRFPARSGTGALHRILPFNLAKQLL
jgi:hypothetical protein